MALSPETAGQPTWSDYLKSGLAFARHNVNQVFAGKFVYFVIPAVVLFLLLAVISAFDDPTPPTANTIYYFLMVPGMLLMLYPSAYAIQADADAHMLETVFGIPDYRYKVWMVRNLIQYVVIALFLLGLAIFCRIGLADFNIGWMVFHVMFPIFFLSSLSFMIATITRSGNGTAAIMVVVMFVMFTLVEWLSGSRWNIYHSPFEIVDPYEMAIWQETTLYNRVYLLVGGLMANMVALLRLQKRERFM